MARDEWCFVHAADLHLDTPFIGVGETDGRLRRRLLDASLEAFDGLVELALREQARFLVLAGDVYDGAERGLRAQVRFERGVRRLADAGIRTFVAHGNHDPVLTGWQLDTSWPDEVHVFGHAEVEHRDVLDDDGSVLAVVHGVSFAERSETRNLAAAFSRTRTEALHVGVLHTNVGGNADHDDYAPCSLDDLRRARMDYWALGHIHRRTVLLDGSDGDPWAVYPGNLQGRSHKPSERDVKGASVVRVSRGAVADVEHVALDRVRFVELVAAVEEETTVGEVVADLVGQARQAMDDAPDRVVVLRGVIAGSSTIAATLAKPDAMRELLDALRDAAPGPDVVWTRLRDRTRPPAAGGAAELLDGHDVDDATLLEDAIAVVSTNGWSRRLPPDEELAAAGRALARTLLQGGGA